MSHPLFGPELRLMLEENDSPGITALFETLHPATIAETLSEEFDVEGIWSVLKRASVSDQAAIFEYFPIEEQVELAEGAEGRPEMARLIEQMSHDDRVALMRRLSARVRESLLRLVDDADRRDIAALTKYDEDSVGAIMTTDYAWLPPHLTASAAIEHLRLLAPRAETIYYIYVLDESTRKLLGVVSLRDLILSRRQMLVRDLMESEIVSLKAAEPKSDAGNVLARYDFLALPVVDDDFRMLGIVTHDDVINVVVAEATEDAHRMGGMSPIEENYLEASFVSIWRKRATWLSCLFVAELFTFTALAFFEDSISKVVVLSLFVPLCISTGGNSGSQAATLITRAMALGQLSPANWARILRHELMMGIALGLTLGCIAFFRGAFTPDSVRGGEKALEHPLMVRVARDKPLAEPADGNYVLQKYEAEILTKTEKKIILQLPEGEKVRVEDRPNSPYLEYEFPTHTNLRETPVDRWALAQVIALAVIGICLWGTLVGSMLPLVFKQLGADPGVASSPFVATFVDVTGIIIYFYIAKAILGI